MVKTRVVVSVGVVPWILANFIRFIVIAVAFGAIIVVPLAWPLLVWSRTFYTRPPSAECYPVCSTWRPVEHVVVTPFGWFAEVIWLVAVVWAVTWFVKRRRARKAAQLEAERFNGPRDWTPTRQGTLI